MRILYLLLGQWWLVLILMKATFAFARKHVSGSKRPQAIAHRGYKAKFPENTMGAFKGAVEVGAEAIETDIHLSKDGVVVLSHVCHPLRSPSSCDSNGQLLGPRPKKVLWERREADRLQLGLPEHTQNAQAAERVDAAPV